MRDIKADPPLRTGEKHKLANQVFWASDAMAFCLFGGRASWDAKTADPTEWRHGRLMEAAFPGYEKVLGPRFPASVLLIKHMLRVDDALVEAAWRYSKLLGPEVFPVGLHEWPPSDAWKPAEVASKFQRTEPAPKARARGALPACEAGAKAAVAKAAVAPHKALATAPVAKRAVAESYSGESCCAERYRCESCCGEGC